MHSARASSALNLMAIAESRAPTPNNLTNWTRAVYPTALRWKPRFRIIFAPIDDYEDEVMHYAVAFVLSLT